MSHTYDFEGWATKNDLKCSDGRVIRHNAFKDDNGRRVPLVWMHQHNTPDAVLGHADLFNCDEGVRAKCAFNESENGQNAKMAVLHGDVASLSIFATHVQQNGPDVIHGSIKEVSLVLAGANPGAHIDEILCHADNGTMEPNGDAYIYPMEELYIAHSEDAEYEEENTTSEAEVAEETEEDSQELQNETREENEPMETQEVAHADEDKTVRDVLNTLNEEQKKAVAFIVGKALEDNDNSQEDDTMKHNVFDKSTEMNGEEKTNVISHADEEATFADLRRYGSLRDSAIAHGITNVEYLFPEATNMNNPPAFVKRDTGWVGAFMSAVHHTPFSRIKSQFANITEDDARAKGYIKGHMKKDEVFPLLKRTTEPTTIYKKQKMDRDDIIDITSFDVVAWLKGEMRMMLDEEIARACLIGDGRMPGDDKIDETHIRPIALDEDFYTIKLNLSFSKETTASQKAKQFITSLIRARKNYKGSGNPNCYITEDLLAECLLLTDNNGRDLYESVDKLAKKLRVNQIIPVPVMDGAKGKNKGDLQAVIVNPRDYNVGADKGGAVSMFDDFDIDYNQQKYLIETRCSGALTVPYSAIAVEFTSAMEAHASAEDDHAKV